MRPCSAEPRHLRRPSSAERIEERTVAIRPERWRGPVGTGSIPQGIVGGVGPTVEVIIGDREGARSGDGSGVGCAVDAIRSWNPINPQLADAGGAGIIQCRLAPGRVQMVRAVRADSAGGLDPQGFNPFSFRVPVGNPSVAETRRLSRSLQPPVAQHVETHIPRPVQFGATGPVSNWRQPARSRAAPDPPKRAMPGLLVCCACLDATRPFRVSQRKVFGERSKPNAPVGLVFDEILRRPANRLLAHAEAPPGPGHH